MPRYNPAVIEPKWQLFWEQHKTFAAPRLPGEQKLYALDMFPYPSGDGLHVGHPEGYTATDIVCRAARMQGKSVIHPMGFDSFGLPAEEHAIKTGTHPRIQTEANIANFRRQLKMLGFSYDWDRELATTDAAYVKWTQWIFLQIYDTWYDTQQDRGRPIAELPIPQEVSAAGDDAVQRYRDTHRLAYQSEAPVNWCPALGTVLANEEVIDGKSERGGHPVVRMPLLQWKLRITAYADRLTNDLADLDWSESIKILQRNWIGKSTGAEVDFFIGAAEGSSPTAAFAAWHGQRAESGFPAEPGDDVLRVYTTRPDTLFGATYMVVAPEHPFVARLTTAAQQDSVEAYCQAASFKSDLDRTELAKEKTGVFTGSYAINPVNGHPIPIWVADYVLISYGTGAIMAVPAHDERDFEFARQFQIPIVPVVDPGQGHPARDGVLAGAVVSSDDGAAINSGRYDGMATADFKKRIRDDLVTDGIGSAAVNYKLRDWLFSRQRFWGEPFPIWHEIDEQGNLTGLRRPVAEQDLPVDLPHLDDFLPHGRPEPPLEKAPEDWLYCELEGRRYKRETNTMPQWAGSCWYYLRFLDPGNERALVDPEVERNWMPVDLYVGGAEHAVLHLLYARFWHKVLYDRGVVSTAEPFQRLINQGMILGEMECTAFREGTGEWVSATDVNHDSDAPVREETAALLHSVSVPLADVTKQGDSFVLTADPTIRVDSRAHKMSKSRGNVVNPDEVVKEYGADSLRLYEMYMGPLEATKPWSMEGVKGVFRFLNRVWRLVVDESAEVSIPTAAGALSSAVVDAVPANEVNRELHKTIKKVTHDIAALAFNTALARMMEFTNLLTKQKRHSQQVLEPLVLILSPFAPHMCEELWSILGHNESLAYEPWPAYDDKIARDENVVIPVQINGKVRAKVEISVAADRNALESAAREDARIADLLAGSNIVKVIVVPGRLVNFVLRG